jgi:hypothetical protein
MRPIVQFPWASVGRVWWWLRQVTGDAAYENYLRWASGRPGAGARNEGEPGKTSSALLSRQDFYLQVLKRRYARVSRCC